MKGSGGIGLTTLAVVVVLEWLSQLIADAVPFHAFLGSRNVNFLNDDSLDICALIVFYQLPGVPATRLNLLR